MSLSFALSNPNSFFLSHPQTLKSPKTLTKSPRFLPQNPRTATITKCSLDRRPEYIPNRIPNPNYTRIFDTTLRDGEQSPGATMTSAEKLAVARHLARLRVDIIEAGFPASSPDDLEAVKSIAREVGNHLEDIEGYVPVICGLARCNKNDIDRAWEAVRFAKRPRIHTFIATSEIHLEHKLRKSREEVARIAREMVAYARSLGCVDIEFSPEDAGRSDREYLYHVLEEVIKAGATTVNIPDTVGYTLPSEFGQLIADIKENTCGIENAIISTHCQNDLGLSTANTLAGAYAGARQLEVTVNGIGERAGNASLEEILQHPRGKRGIEELNYQGIFGGLGEDYPKINLEPSRWGQSSKREGTLHLDVYKAPSRDPYIPEEELSRDETGGQRYNRGSMIWPRKRGFGRGSAAFSWIYGWILATIPPVSCSPSLCSL